MPKSLEELQQTLDGLASVSRLIALGMKLTKTKVMIKPMITLI